VNRWRLALLIAIVLDVLDFAGGFIPGFGDVLDIFGVIVLFTLIGLNSLIGLAELIPMVDFLPLNIVAVISARGRLKKEGAR
jgi:hypothetical protein